VNSLELKHALSLKLHMYFDVMQREFRTSYRFPHSEDAREAVGGQSIEKVNDDFFNDGIECVHNFAQNSACHLPAQIALRSTDTFSSSFTLGVPWAEEVVPAFDNIKEEVLNNPYECITPEQWSTVFKKSHRILQPSADEAGRGDSDQMVSS